MVLLDEFAWILKINTIIVWSDVPIEETVSQISVSSGDEDSTKSIVVADELVTRVCPVGIIEGACWLIISHTSNCTNYYNMIHQH